MDLKHVKAEGKRDKVNRLLSAVYAAKSTIEQIYEERKQTRLDATPKVQELTPEEEQRLDQQLEEQTQQSVEDFAKIVQEEEEQEDQIQRAATVTPSVFTTTTESSILNLSKEELQRVLKIQFDIQKVEASLEKSKKKHGDISEKVSTYGLISSLKRSREDLRATVRELCRSTTTTTTRESKPLFLPPRHTSCGCP